jgi:hypothetical protein
MSGKAIKIAQTNVEPTNDDRKMGTVTCSPDRCGEMFTIYHDNAHADDNEAAQQAQWLEEKLEEEHRKGRGHEDAYDLPSMTWRAV